VLRARIAGVAAVVVALVVVAAAMFLLLLLVSRSLLVAVLLALAFVVAFTVSVLLARRADPEQLKDFSQKCERGMQTLGLALAKASGGWAPRRPPPCGARTDDDVSGPDDSKRPST
jgi:hypothetical protein